MRALAVRRRELVPWVVAIFLAVFKNQPGGRMGIRPLTMGGRVVWCCAVYSAT